MDRLDRHLTNAEDKIAQGIYIYMYSIMGGMTDGAMMVGELFFSIRQTVH